MRVGVFAGLMDPLHTGYRAMFDRAFEASSLDAICLLPVAASDAMSDPEERIAMARLACEWDARLKTVGRCVSGVKDALDALEEMKLPQSADAWVFLTNEGVGLSADAGNRDKAKSALRRCCESAFNGTFSESERISCETIQRAVCRGKDVSTLVPETIASYIDREGLYLANRSKRQILQALNQTLKPGRYRHTLGVAETAGALAERTGESRGRAVIAGLLHDCAKSLSIPEMMALFEKCQYMPDAQELGAPAVLHAPAGMLLARQEYGVRDAGLLQAIRRHTLGGKDMTRLDSILYVADFIEPNRKPFEGLEQVRTLAQSDLNAAVCACARLTMAHVVRQGGTPHPNTVYLAEKSANIS